MNLDDPLILEFVINLPALVTMLVGMVLVAANRHRHPLAARWALFAFGWLFVTYILEILWRNIGIPHFFRNRQLEVPSLVALSIFESLAYVLFLIAFFMALTPYRPRHFYDDDLLDDFPTRPTNGDPHIQEKEK
jgi:hypothetical protein